MIGHDEVNGPLEDRRERGFAGWHGEGAVAGQLDDLAEILGEGPVVIDDQDADRGRRPQDNPSGATRMSRLDPPVCL